MALYLEILYKSRSKAIHIYSGPFRGPFFIYCFSNVILKMGKGTYRIFLQGMNKLLKYLGATLNSIVFQNLSD